MVKNGPFDGLLGFSQVNMERLETFYIAKNSLLLFGVYRNFWDTTM
jgi:hypothetical protein